MVHSPVLASRLNQGKPTAPLSNEIRSLPTTSTDLDVVEQRLTGFETRENAAAKPFKWKSTTNDLADLLDRLDRHQQAQDTRPQPTHRS